MALFSHKLPVEKAVPQRRFTVDKADKSAVGSIAGNRTAHEGRDTTVQDGEVGSKHGFAHQASGKLLLSDHLACHMQVLDGGRAHTGEGSHIFRIEGVVHDRQRMPVAVECTRIALRVFKVFAYHGTVVIKCDVGHHDGIQVLVFFVNNFCKGLPVVLVPQDESILTVVLVSTQLEGEIGSMAVFRPFAFGNRSTEQGRQAQRVR